MSIYKNIKVGVIDYKLNNLFSIYNALKKIGYNVKIIDTEIKDYNSYDLVVLPGVGSYDSAMKYIKAYNIDNKINDFIENKNFLFGICLGMQLLFEKSSEFKNTKGLGIIKGSVKNLKKNKNNPVPHIGWNSLINVKTNELNLEKKNNFYFVHSLYCSPKDKKHILSETKYGTNKFCSAIRNKNIIATQFHPEKSGPSGINLLKNLRNIL